MSARMNSPCVANDRDERMQSLRLLKSKLRAGRGQRKATQNAVVTFKGPQTNQQEESMEPSKDFPASTKEQLTVPATVQDEITAKKSSSNIDADYHHSNQDEISVAELRKELALLKAGPQSLLADQPPQLLSGVAPPFFSMKMKSYTKTMIQWMCSTCERECIPIREESRCLCGHRYKEHPSSADDPRVKSPARFKAFACTSAKCSCKAFFYVVAEGAWILRCRCKHKHIDHDPGSKPFVCKKPKCSCAGFDSPWVCNCDHPWSAHRQQRVVKKFDPLQLLQGQCDVQELNTVHRTDLQSSPLNLRL